MEKIIPKLRFPDFKGDWVSTDLGNVFSIFNGYAFSSNDSVDSGTLWVKIADVGILEMKVDSLSYLPENYKKKHQKFLLKKGDYVIALTRPILNGKLKIAQINDFFNDSLLNQRVGKIVTDNCKSFIYCLLQKENLINDIENSIAGTDPPNLSPSQINSISVYIPYLPEQTKIASCLSNVDNKINQQKKKKSLLVQYKKGVMEQFFSQELRFKDEDGNDFADWEENVLGEIGDAYNGLTGKSKENFGVGKPYIQYKQIFDDSRIDISRFEYVEIGDNDKQNKVKFGDAFFTVSSETPNEVGMASILLDEVGELYLNSFCFGYRADTTILDPYFSRYLFHSDLFRKDVVLLAQGSTRFNISKTQFMKLVVALPSLPEQQKIASFLSSIDDKIAQTALQIEKMQLWKKGLLQQMFV